MVQELTVVPTSTILADLETIEGLQYLLLVLSNYGLQAKTKADTERCCERKFFPLMNKEKVALLTISEMMSFLSPKFHVRVTFTL